MQLEVKVREVTAKADRQADQNKRLIDAIQKQNDDLQQESVRLRIQCHELKRELSRERLAMIKAAEENGEAV